MEPGTLFWSLGSARLPLRRGASAGPFEPLACLDAIRRAVAGLGAAGRTFYRFG